MSTLPIGADGRVAIANSAPAAGDNYRGGMIVSAAGLVRGASVAGVQSSGGFSFDATGRLCYLDATAGLPAGATFCNGLPMSSTGQLLTSTGPAAYWSGGIPYVANGSVAATIV